MTAVISSGETSTAHRLQAAQWPTGASVGIPEKLYFRATPRTNWIFDPAGSVRSAATSDGTSVLEFGTFFGALSLTTWCGAAAIDEVTLRIKFKGQCTLRVFEDNGYDSRSLLLEKRVSSNGIPLDITITELKTHRGILYPLFHVYQGDNLEFLDLSYYTSQVPVRTPRLAIVMPTYKREMYARRNIELIRTQVLEEQPNRCKLFVVDNGQTLDLEECSGIELIKNRNFGGSGGFARGVLEAGRSAEPFTHMLFCDDDVLVDPQAINRLLTLLGYIETDRIVSGGMMKMGEKNILHEKSANVVGVEFSSNKANRDLTEIESVARYDEETFSTFCGWWFVCYPLCSGRDRFLPMPFFVGWDDVEMGLRCNRLKLRTISLLGVAIWHDEFEKKDVNWRWYYHARNALVTALLYDDGKRALNGILREIMTALLTYRYERAQFMIEGLAAVAQGSKSITGQGADEIHQRLVGEQKNNLIDVSRSVIPDRYGMKYKPSKLRLLLSRVTMNGHLLPMWMFMSAAEPSHAGWAVENIHSQSLVRIFRRPKVVYYEPTSGKGIICKIDHGRYYRLLRLLLVRWIKLRLQWPKLRVKWREDQVTLTSPEFWKSYLDLRD